MEYGADCENLEVEAGEGGLFGGDAEAEEKRAHDVVERQLAQVIFCKGDGGLD